MGGRSTSGRTPSSVSDASGRCQGQAGNRALGAKCLSKSCCNSGCDRGCRGGGCWQQGQSQLPVRQLEQQATGDSAAASAGRCCWQHAQAGGAGTGATLAAGPPAQAQPGRAGTSVTTNARHNNPAIGRRNELRKNCSKLKLVTIGSKPSRCSSSFIWLQGRKLRSRSQRYCTMIAATQADGIQVFETAAEQIHRTFGCSARGKRTLCSESSELRSVVVGTFAMSMQFERQT